MDREGQDLSALAVIAWPGQVSAPREPSISWSFQAWSFPPGEEVHGVSPYVNT